jgi:hypothetical protein
MIAIAWGEFVQALAGREGMTALPMLPMGCDVWKVSAPQGSGCDL